MPLLLTPPAPFTNDALLEVAAAYAIILQVSYDTRQKVISYNVGYYASEAAYVQQAAALRINALPVSFTQAATADQANAVPIFTFLEQMLTEQLTQLLGEGTTIENVP
jgi:hypothetical protein